LGIKEKLRAWRRVRRLQKHRLSQRSDLTHLEKGVAHVYETQRERTADPGQLRGCADRPSASDAFWRFQFRPPIDHQQHRRSRESGKSVRSSCCPQHGGEQEFQRKSLAADQGCVSEPSPYRAYFDECLG